MAVRSDVSSPNTHQSHAVRERPVELQLAVHFEEVVMTSDLNRPVAHAAHGDDASPPAEVQTDLGRVIAGGQLAGGHGEVGIDGRVKRLRLANVNSTQ